MIFVEIYLKGMGRKMINHNETEIKDKLDKREFNQIGKTIIVSNIITILAGVVGMILISIFSEIINSITHNTISIFTEENNKGIIDIFIIVVGFYPFIIFKGKKFFLNDLMKENKKINLKLIIISILILFSINNILGEVIDGLEKCLNAIGLSTNNALLQLEELNSSTIPMILSICIIAPIFEELIYRGVILKSLEKYGRFFAILTSAILFGLAHGNFYQTPHTIIIGVFWGYLATEYSIKLSILLHIVNNVWAKFSDNIFTNMSSNMENIINWGSVFLGIVILLIIIINKREQIKTWLRDNKIEKGIMRKFFTSKLIMVIIAFDIISLISGIGKM